MAKTRQSTKAKDTTTFDYIAGLDIGNGYVKGGVGPNKYVPTAGAFAAATIDMPSAMSYINGRFKDPVSARDALSYVSDHDGEADFFNKVDVTIDSPSIEYHSGLHYRVGAGAVGALNTVGGLVQFHIGDNESKSEQDISIILALSTIAAKVVQDYVALHGELPDSAVNATCVLAVALPIDEYVRYRKRYVRRFIGGDEPVVHMITVHNFDKPVPVALKFVDVVVIAEGASAQFAINEYGEDVQAAMLADAKKYAPALEAYTVEDLVHARNIVGIDIGEGTVNFPVYTDRNFNADSSVTLYTGYGDQLSAALDELPGYGSRKALSEFLVEVQRQQREGAYIPTRTTRAYDQARRVLTRFESVFAESIAAEFMTIMKRIGGRVDAVYIYGGGSAPMREVLYPLLIARASDFLGEEVIPPIVYVDGLYSRDLNKAGLTIAADRLAKRVVQG